jgi:hypothetical protein
MRENHARRAWQRQNTLNLFGKWRGTDWHS